MAGSPRIPKYRRRSSGQARVTLRGPFGSPESQEAYRRLVDKHLQSVGHPNPRNSAAEPLTVNELILAYWKHAEQYYGFAGTNRGDAYCLRDALRVVRSLYGRSPAAEFGPLALKACRRQMVDRG